MKKVPLVEALKSYVEEGNAPFSMPGHKSGRGFKQEIDGINFYELMLSADMTEVDGLDNLHKPDGPIKEALEKLSSLYGSQKSYFLVNGSTSGNLIMSYTCFEEEDKVLVERNCHRSIMNSLIMRKLNPLYMKNEIDDKLKIPVSIDKQHFLKLLNENDDIKGVFITYPNYYGIGCDIEFIINECKKRKVKVLIDCAHGAHFGIHPRLPKNPVKLGADMVVMSAHKTLPSLTQTSYLHVNDKNLIEKADFYFGVFQSTSPSYLFLGSMDYSRAFLEYEGSKAYEDLFKKLDKTRKEINKLSYVRALDRSHINKSDIVIDDSRIILCLRDGYSGHKLLDMLRKYKIQAEMSDDNNVVLLCSPFNTEEDFQRLVKVLNNIELISIEGNSKSIYTSKLPKQGMIPAEAFIQEKEMISIDFSVGRITAENVVPYPPGVPMLIMGEIIENSHIESIKKYINDGVTVLGIEDNRIKVIRE